MMIRLGRVSSIVRYPVKSMAGVATESARLGWHGLAGDRRFAFRRIGDEGDFPWLSASRLPGLLLYHPLGDDDSSGEPRPTRVRTPSGEELDIRGAALQRKISEKCGFEVEMMKLRNGMFDDAPMSVISGATIAGIGRECGMDLDRRRFRANVYLETENAEPFCEDAWVGGTLVFGESDSAPALAVTQRDVRCMMINLDPETAKQDGRVMKKVVALNGNNAGVYGTVVRTGVIEVGQTVRLA